MAWKYPKFDIRSGYVVDIDPINDNLLSVVSEISGTLNEHNFNSEEGGEVPLSRLQLDAGAAFRLHTSSKAVSNEVTSPVNSDWLRIQQTDGWQTFDSDGAVLEFVSRGAMTWLCASFQIMATYGTSRSSLEKFQKGFGFLVALKLDGTVIYDSLLGSGDPQTDFFRGPENRAAKKNPSLIAAQATPYGGGGLSGARLPVVVDAMLELSPGPHKLELTVMSVRGYNWASEGVPRASISSREIFALEMRR
tara:strand:- start:12333 stop:13079 length:747 start_codon:yes stop_codon:yes gene_type:complete